MRCILAPLVLCAVLLGGCAQPTAVTPPPPLAPAPSATTTERPLRQQVNDALLEATIVMATRISMIAGATPEPTLEAESARRYLDNLATITALEPIARAQNIDLVPASEPPTDPTDAAHLAQAQTAAAAVAPVVVSEPTGGAMPLIRPTGEPLDPNAFPVAPATSALAGVVLPATYEAMEALFSRLPPTLAGADRLSDLPPPWPGELIASYGADVLPDGSPSARIWLRAIDLERTGNLLPGWVSANVVARYITDPPPATTGWGRDGQLYWVRRHATIPGDPPREFHTLMLGTDTGPWLLELTAASPEELEALAAALAGAS